MSQQPNAELLPYEERVGLAIQAIRKDATLSERRAAAIYNARRTTLQDRRAGKASRRDIQANSSKLTKHEDEAILRYVSKLDARGFAPTLGYLREMADQLLAVRSGSPVGENWATTSNYVRRKPKLKS